MTHQHAHNHTQHLPQRVSKVLVAGIAVNLVFVVIEAGTGFFTKSLSLLTDAGHNLSDVASLALALLANKLAQKKGNKHFSFGYRQSTILVSLVNAGILLFAVGAIVYEAVLRLAHPEPVKGGVVAIVAGIGIVINALTALLFYRDRKKDINLKGAYLHMLSDALVSFGVVISGLIIIYTGWFWLDTIVSIVIAFVIVTGTWGLLMESLRLTLNGVPADIDMVAVEMYLKEIDGVTDVYDLHIWAISTTQNALTVHLTMPDQNEYDPVYAGINKELRQRFNIGHTTIQINKTHGDFSCDT